MRVLLRCFGVGPGTKSHIQLRLRFRVPLNSLLRQWRNAFTQSALEATRPCTKSNYACFSSGHLSVNLTVISSFVAACVSQPSSFTVGFHRWPL
eukprot:5642373-Alexandrium_andersonii.AAC.1